MKFLKDFQGSRVEGTSNRNQGTHPDPQQKKLKRKQKVVMSLPVEWGRSQVWPAEAPNQGGPGSRQSRSLVELTQREDQRPKEAQHREHKVAQARRTRTLDGEASFTAGLLG